MHYRLSRAILLLLFMAVFAVQAHGATVTYTYDESGRLMKADYGGDDWISYDFDGSGNMENEIVKQFPLSVTKIGSGDGLVTSDAAGIFCGDDCLGLYPLGTTVTLTATPNSNAAFMGWSGEDCSGTGSCQIEITANPIDVSATFTRTRVLTAILGGSGSGSVTSDPPGIDCGEDCQETFVEGTEITFSLIPDQGSYAVGGEEFSYTVSWSTGNVYFNFNLIQHDLTVSKAGTGTGTVVSTDGFVDCGADCGESYNEGNEVTLVAVAEAGSAFSGWSGGDCSGTGECTTVINADRSVTATFTKLNNTLSVSRTGSGTGTITSSPAGIDCGGDCQEVYDVGAQITLSAAADAGSGFRGWFGGGCYGSGDCVVTMTRALSVSALFDLNGADLFVDQAGGDDTNSGISWDAAKKTIQAAINEVDGVTLQTIHVKEGAYNEIVALRQGLDLVGGYPAANTGTDVSGRDPVAHPAVLDAGGEDYAMSSGGYGDGILDVFALAEDDIFAVSTSSNIYHYDGTFWSRQTTPLAQLYGVWGSASDNVMAVGALGRIVQYNGSSWSAMTSNTTSFLYDIWGSAADDVFAVGGYGTILHYDGFSWSQMSHGFTDSLNAVWGTASDDVYAVDVWGKILHYDGVSWSQMTSDNSEQLSALWGTGGSDIFTVGLNGTILHYDGSSWTAMTCPTAEWLRNVWGTAADDVYAVGNNGTILHYDGTDWTQMTAPDDEHIDSIWGFGQSTIFVMGSALNPISWDGVQWRRRFGSENISIRGFTFTNAAWGALIANMDITGLIFEENRVTGNDYGGVWFDNKALGVSFRNNTFIGNDSGSGVEFNEEADGITAENNIFIDSWTGLHWYGPASDIWVNNNQVTGDGTDNDWWYAGIQFWDTASGVGMEGNEISDFLYEGGHGIMFWDNSDSLTIHGNTLADLDGGGGMHIWGDVSGITVSDNIFSNLSGWETGLIFWDEVATGQISGNSFSGMDLGYNGLLFWDSVFNLEVKENSFTDLSGEYSGVIFYSPADTVTVSNNILSDLSDDTANGQSLKWSGILFEDDTSETFVSANHLENLQTSLVESNYSMLGITFYGNVLNSQVDGNEMRNVIGFKGDGISLIEDTRDFSATGFVVKNNILSQISTDHQHGGILFEYGGQDCRVYNNIVSQSSVGLSCAYSVDYSWESILFINNTLWANSVGIYEAGSGNSFVNNIVSDSTLTGIQLDNTGSTSVFSHNNVFASGLNYLGLTDPTGTDGNIAADPRYQDPTAGDFFLLQCSAAIDAGFGSTAPSLDMGGNGRFDDPNTMDSGSGSYSHCDMGAFEYQGGSGDTLPLDVTVEGSGRGVVTSEPGELLCDSSCSVELSLCADVTLTAAPDPDSQFVGWSDACSGTELTCTMSMQEARAVSASFCALQTYYRDSDLDTYGDPADFIRACEQPDGYVAAGGDCDDSDSSVSPAATEVCDGRDNDCIGGSDDAFPSLGQSCTEGVGSCAESGTWVCSGDGLNVLCDAVPGSPAAELCDGADNDCDGDTDEDFPLLGQPCSQGTGICFDTGYYACQPDGMDVVCDAGVIAPEQEVCDGEDNDCDGLVDEASCYVFSDIDADNDHDGKDIALFISAYASDYGPLGPGESSAADINLDNVVDAADIAAFVGDFGKIGE
ncbi:MAG: right-handed parallel beta-helix repeat-containing protein [Desulfobulbaceae bacterium]|nr:right-handed parallel beta-helix repeat-containing protein [Desulfobulbaceae bacterium]